LKSLIMVELRLLKAFYFTCRNGAARQTGYVLAESLAQTGLKAIRSANL